MYHPVSSALSAPEIFRVVLGSFSHEALAISGPFEYGFGAWNGSRNHLHRAAEQKDAIEGQYE